MEPRLRLISLLLVAATSIGCEPEELISNALIDRWCGDRPCSWEVKGEIKRVGTWHPRDFAVRFVSDDAQISQHNGRVATGDDCYDFTMLAKVDRSAHLFLELDFLDDGKVDYSKRIPESNWERRGFSIAAPTWYDGVRFILRKDGPGYAAIAQLSAELGNECTGSPIELDGRPAFAPCDEDSECASGSCNASDRCDCAEDGGCVDAGSDAGR
jgi:hypothetical protein